MRVSAFGHQASGVDEGIGIKAGVSSVVVNAPQEHVWGSGFLTVFLERVLDGLGFRV